MLTAEEVAVQAMARVSVVTDNFPTTRSLMYRRIGVRQQQLFADAASINNDYFGTCASVALVAGAADLRDIASPVPTPQQIQKIIVHAVGVGSVWAVGKEVAIVALGDIEAELSPRMTLRDGVLRAVGTDLNNVTEVMVYYARQAKMLGPSDANTATEVPSPFDELLVVDLAAYLLQGVAAVEGNARAAALASLGAEEESLLGAWTEHVESYAAVNSRFARPPAGPRAVEPK